MRTTMGYVAFLLGLVALVSCTATPPPAAAAPPTGQALERPTVPPTPDTTQPSTPRPTDPPSAAPSTDPVGDGPAVYLSGPFGYLDGVAGSGWDPIGELRPLDPLVARPPLIVDFRDLDREFASWVLLAAPFGSASDSTMIALDQGPAPDERDDAAYVDGPDAGDWLLRADIVPTDAPPDTYLWRLVVPDVPRPSDGVVIGALPTLLVVSAGQEVEAVPGSSCYLTVCGEVPLPDSPRGLPRLQGTGAISFRFADGSRVIRWVVSGVPASRPGAPPLSFGFGEAPEGADHFGLDGISSGTWIVRVDVTFDLERGTARYDLVITSRS